MPAYLRHKEHCNAHNQSKHNIFINYRVKTEGNKSKFSSVVCFEKKYFIFYFQYYFNNKKQEPVGGVVEYLYSLLAVQKTKTGEPIFVFWDKQCLNDGYNWEQGFARGLTNSQMIILLMSNQVYLSEKKFKK